jgi:hypothetical protein
MLKPSRLRDDTFVLIASGCVEFLRRRLVSGLRDLKSDRGPYAYTAGTFYNQFLRDYKKALVYTVVKLNYRAGINGDIVDLCGRLEELLQQYQDALVTPLKALAFDRKALMKALCSETDARTSLATRLSTRLAEFDRVLASAEALREDFRNQYPIVREVFPSSPGDE